MVEYLPGASLSVLMPRNKPMGTRWERMMEQSKAMQGRVRETETSKSGRRTSTHPGSCEREVVNAKMFSGLHIFLEGNPWSLVPSAWTLAIA